MKKSSYSESYFRFDEETETELAPVLLLFYLMKSIPRKLIWMCLRIGWFCNQFFMTRITLKETEEFYAKKSSQIPQTIFLRLKINWFKCKGAIRRKVWKWKHGDTIDKILIG
jgi:hypothetical protein